MVFYIAAATKHRGPGDPMRPAELLHLTGFYATPADAWTALDGMGKHLAQAAVERTLFGGRERTMYDAAALHRQARDRGRPPAG